MIAGALKRKGAKKTLFSTEYIIAEEPNMVLNNGKNTLVTSSKAGETGGINQIRRCAMFKNLSQGFRNFSRSIGSPERHIPIIDQIQCIHRVLEYPMIEYVMDILMSVYWSIASFVPCMNKIIQLMFSIGGVIIVFASPFGLSLWDAVMCRILDVIEAIFPDIRAPINKKRNILSEINCCDLSCCSKIDHTLFCCNHPNASTSKTLIGASIHPECVCQKQSKRSTQSFSLENSIAEELGIDKS